MINFEFKVPKEKKAKKGDENPLAKPKLYFIVGGTGAGKSTLIANLLMAFDEHYDWDNALFVTGNNRDDMLKAIEMPITTSPIELDNFITKIQQPVTEPTFNLIVLDDIQANPDFNIMSRSGNFAKFILSHRHYGKVNDEGGTFVIMTAQTLKGSYAPTIKKQVTMWFTFYPRDSDEMKSIEEVSGDKMKMKKAMAIQKLEGKHAFLFINKTDSTDVKYFLGFKQEIDVS